ncbi:MAG: PKD domain-containing protein [Planctomycetota bacterium]
MAAFTVKAWDGYLASSSPVQVNVNVTASNNAPVAVANGPYLVGFVGASLTLNAAGSYDPDANDVLSYSWDLNGDNNFNDAVGINPTLTWAELVALGLNTGSTTKQIKLRVRDVTHGINSADVTAVLQMPPTTVTPGYSQDFEAVHVTQMGSEWSFLPVGTGLASIVTYDSQSGDKSLGLGQTTSNGTSSVSAVLAMDLSGYVGQNNLRYSFWARDNFPEDRMNLYVSGDGVNWSSFLTDFTFPIAEPFQKVEGDLDQILNTAGITFDSSVFFKIERTGGSGVLLIDDFNLYADPIVNAGLRVESTSDLRIVGNLYEFDVMFSEAIDPSTFTSADLVWSTSLVPKFAITDSGDHQLFTIIITTPDQWGNSLTLKIGPNILSADGDLMNQDGDQAFGEANDFARVPVNFNRALPAELIAFEDFEVESVEDLTDWTINNDPETGVSAAISSGAMPGSRGLLMTDYSDPYNTAYATWSIDLSGYLNRTDLTVDFWANENWEFDDYFNYTTVLISGDGVNFSLKSIIGDPETDNSVHYSFDLDQLMAQRGLSNDPTIYLQFARPPEYFADLEIFMPTYFSIDSVRVAAGFPANRFFVMEDSITSQPIVPLTSVSYVDVEFSRNMLPSWLDAFLQDSNGNYLELSWVQLADARHFRFNFASPLTVAGDYTLTLPNYIASKNDFMRLDQNGNGVQNEVADNYVIPITIIDPGPTAPTLTSINPLSGGQEDQGLTITYATLAAKANEADVNEDPISFLIESVTSGTLTKNGVAVIPGVTLLSAGEELVWTPAINAFGTTVAAFTVKAWDGTFASATPVQVNVNVSASPGAPVAAVNGPYSVLEGDSLTLSAAGSYDPDLYDVLSYSWDVNGDNVFGDATGANPTLTWSQLLALGINDGGVRQVKLRVTDVTHNSTTTSSAVNLQIQNGAPSVTVDGPAAVAVGQSVSFDFTATDPSPVDQAGSFFFIIDWNGVGFGDDFLPGTANLSVNHTFTQAGPNQVKVTVTDKDGGVSAVTTYVVNVSGVALVWTGSTNQLVVAGTEGDDVYELEQINPTTIALHTLMLDGVAVGTSETYYGVGAGVVVHGFGGNDSIVATALTDSPVTIYGGIGNDTLRGGGANDQLFGEDDVDHIFGGLGNDQVDGGDGADVLYGEWENPSNGIVYGTDTLIGGEGNDTIYGDGDGGEGAGDSIQGDAGDDLIYGDGNIGKKTATDTIHGGLGNDTIYGDSDGGEAASDLIYGDEDNDVIYADGSKGSKTAMDTVHGGAGDDIIFGDKNGDGGEGASDSLMGDAGNDIIDTGKGSDYADGGDGDDLILGGDGGEGTDDTLVGNDGNDMLVGGVGSDSLDGGAGEDLLIVEYTPATANGARNHSFRMVVFSSVYEPRRQYPRRRWRRSTQQRQRHRRPAAPSSTTPPSTPSSPAAPRKTALRQAKSGHPSRRRHRGCRHRIG